jgi:hypothetical protein
MIWALAIALTSAVPAAAQLPSPFRKSSEPAGIELPPNAGPWLIMCASFVGEGGEQQARELVRELREQFHLDAWIYRHSFDYTGSIRAIGWDPPKDGTGAPVPKQLTPAHTARFEEIAVVVGSFPSIDDHQAAETLEKIKTAHPKSLELQTHVSTNQRMGVLRNIQRQLSGNPDVREKGPMGAAFLMPNPMLPPEYFQQRTIDDVLVKLNKGNKYNLLECEGKFSVKVATFRGDQTFSAREIERKQREFDMLVRSGQPVRESKLAEAGVKANLLCTALRKMGIEAWEFHDHHESYVCVGSFDWASRHVDYGPDELNPEIAEVIRQFKATETVRNGTRIMVPRTINVLEDLNINFDAQPLPVQVPQASVSRGILDRLID